MARVHRTIASACSGELDLRASRDVFDGRGRQPTIGFLRRGVLRFRDLLGREDTVRDLDLVVCGYFNSIGTSPGSVAKAKAADRAPEEQRADARAEAAALPLERSHRVVARSRV